MLINSLPRRKSMREVNPPRWLIHLFTGGGIHRIEHVGRFGLVIA